MCVMEIIFFNRILYFIFDCEMMDVVFEVMVLCRICDEFEYGGLG